MQVLGTGLADFKKMFDLTADDLSKKILECGDISNFNTEIHKQNPQVVSYHQTTIVDKLPFKNDEFELVLSAYQVFNHHNEQDIYALISEMIRVAFEVRIYPLCDEKGILNPLLGVIMARLQAANLRVEIRAVDYEAFKGSNAMLRIWREQCEL